MRGLDWRLPLLVVAAGSLAYFAFYFDEKLWQPSVDLAWAVASLGLLGALWRREPRAVPRLPQPVWFYALYVAALLPFATNWRWAMTADNLSWPLGGLTVAEHGPTRSLLSANGADNFGYLQMMLHDIFMFVVSPTMFWHRVGKIVVGVCALAAVYSAFARLVAPRFGLLVAACAATTSVWIVYTYASVPFMDGIAMGYAILAVGLWVRREPNARTPWLVLGWLSGFMLFLTPNGWFIAICVWAWLGPQVLFRRWKIGPPALAIAVALVTGLPMLIQWSQGGGGQLFSLVQHPGWTQEKVIGFLREAAYIPFDSPIQGAGAFGPQLPQYFRWLFIPGILLTPIFARRFPGARLIFAFYVVQVLLLAFAQGPYASVSVKRALIIIPMATYFVFLPFHRWLRSLAVVLPIIAIWASFGIYDVAARMQPGRTGYNFLDGVIEADQRFADAPVCIYVSKPGYTGHFAPGTPVDRLFGLSPHVQIVDDLQAPACARTLCYQPQIDHPNLAALGYREVPIEGSVELRCGRRSQ